MLHSEALAIGLFTDACPIFTVRLVSDVRVSTPPPPVDAMKSGVSQWFSRTTMETPWIEDMPARIPQKYSKLL